MSSRTQRARVGPLGGGHRRKCTLRSSPHYTPLLLWSDQSGFLTVVEEPELRHLSLSLINTQPCGQPRSLYTHPQKTWGPENSSLFLNMSREFAGPLSCSQAESTPASLPVQWPCP